MGRLIPFEYCDKKVTPWGGMRLIKGYLNRCGVYDKLRELDLQIPGSAVGVPHYAIIESFMMSVKLVLFVIKFTISQCLFCTNSAV